MPSHHDINNTPTGRNTPSPANQTEFAFALAEGSSACSASTEGENFEPCPTGQEPSRANPPPEPRAPRVPQTIPALAADPSTGRNHAPSVAPRQKATASAALRQFRQTHKRIELYLTLDDWWFVSMRAQEAGKKVPEVVRALLVDWARNAGSANCPKDQSQE